MFTRSNPVWSDSVIYDFRDRLAAVVPDSWLPIEVPGSKRPTFKDYGCGHYGCVMPTNTPNLVCKVTTDVLEARFVAAMLKMKHFPDGIVRYEKIVALEGRTFRKRPVFVLWREEAYEVGKVHIRQPGGAPWVYHPGTYDEQMLKQFLNRLAWFKDTSHRIRACISKHPNILETIKPYKQWAYDITAERYEELFETQHSYTFQHPTTKLISAYRGVQRVALALRICETLAELMENEPEGYLVGGALSYYLDEGILLADVHSANIGKTERPETYGKGLTPWVITDPGHAVFLDARHEPISIPVI